jgi:hypothetical protein
MNATLLDFRAEPPMDEETKLALRLVKLSRLAARLVRQWAPKEPVNFDSAERDGAALELAIVYDSRRLEALIRARTEAGV